MKILSYRAIIKKDGKRYHGFVPALPGCHTDGDTVEDTRRNLREAITGWIESRRDDGWPIPVDESIESLESVEIDFDPKKDNLSYA